jgi:flagellin-specific chaperone FliS
MSPSEFAYRQTAAAGTDGFGLMIALYDTLAGDLRRGAEAERRNDITERSRQLNHAMLVLGFLENQVNKGTEGELYQALIAFYRRLRRRILESQAKRSPEILEQEMAQVLKIRTNWQKLASPAEQAPAYLPPVARRTYPGSTSLAESQNSKSWSA